MTMSNKLNQLPKQFFASLVAKVNKKIATGADVINLGQGNPDQPTPAFIVEATKKALEDPMTHKYSQFRGNQAYKQAAADFYFQQYGIKVDPEKEIAVMGGSKIGLVELPLALLNPGETIVLPDPGYPDYLSGVALADVKQELIPLKPENGYLPNYEEWSPELRKAAKLLYLNYPNNPTGAQATKAFFEDTVRFAKANDLWVVHDFAYGALGNGQKAPVSFLQAEGAKDVGVELYTLSKTYNMAGWRVAFAVGNAEIIEAINLIQDHLFVGIFPALQAAGVAALTSGEGPLQAIATQYANRRQAFVTAAAQIGWQAYPSDGAFYCWMPVPEGMTSEEFSDLLLEKVAVAVAPGVGFGEQGEGFVRVGLTIDEDRLIEAVARIGTLHLFA
ncbi:pyridoxal phosphate-dependent aminotransferase [Enterococcus camelliae]|uniref:Pyridoxal phosphate-dependent aminotransferase n=1 Tax=Enterococcus camelliae TaxID=453959 RepID=A0ABW5TI54_9ENTE